MLTRESLHVSPPWAGLRRRWSGGTITCVFAWLILSGYLLYYLGSENARSWVSVLHWGIALVSPVCFRLHRVRFRKRRVSSQIDFVEKYRERSSLAQFSGDDREEESA
jgi:hypothetical protein